ncbi:MAG: hypothetical protein COS85_21640 [Armatimonadetes bacterium CG07_land_8_20_14_0_80_59_28]|nr:MAG: hypothetical protein COS85_21640 [Armatimonadetes bacterium CG07_land_8_20_14_0_80_59_28]PIX38093.1 MAG: hypothetical protein COZ56_21445 [Armatimonadetes bacterium CG_4_8_14_3_um_filter_58_9]PJB70600.1 MAG: hypothetical protein CO095_08870 [Armatimonadetes bacterium CG_4_9_14_3_um_filter_58_7]
MTALPICFMLFLQVSLLGGCGRGGPDFDDLTISDSYEEYRSSEITWKIYYESNSLSRFRGKVRFAAPIRERNLDIVTHDILVTSGQYADPEMVSTSVSGHIYTWRSGKTSEPSGAINLLHTVPASKGVYESLCKIRDGDKVTISGWEIDKVEAFDKSANAMGTWQDMGCNSLLVNKVQREK